MYRHDSIKDDKLQLIRQLVSTTQYQIVDIVKSDGIVLVLSDDLGYLYTVSWSNFKKNLGCRHVPTPHNVSVTCKLHGCTFYSISDGLVTYDYQGTLFTKPYIKFRHYGHQHQTLNTAEDIIQHAAKLDVQVELVEKSRVSYICANGYGPYTLRWHQFLKKTTDKCNICNQSKGMKYLPSTIDKYKGTLGMLYVVELSNDKEKFYKVGLTKFSAEKRFRYLRDYGVRIIHEYKLPIPEAYRIEQAVLRQYSDYKYIPKIHIGGWSECLYVSPAELDWYIRGQLNA